MASRRLEQKFSISSSDLSDVRERSRVQWMHQPGITQKELEKKRRQLRQEVTHPSRSSGWRSGTRPLKASLSKPDPPKRQSRNL